MSTTDNQESKQVLAIEIPRAPELRVRSAAISESVAADHEGCCPICSCDSVLIQGHFQREFKEEIFGGQTFGETLSDECVKNITAITCAACKIRYVIEPDEVFDLREEHMQVTMELAKQMKVPVDSGNQQVN